MAIDRHRQELRWREFSCLKQAENQDVGVGGHGSALRVTLEEVYKPGLEFRPLELDGADQQVIIEYRGCGRLHLCDATVLHRADGDHLTLSGVVLGTVAVTVD